MAPAHRSNPVLAPEEQFLRPLFFVRPKKIILIGEKYETKVGGNGLSYCFVSYWWIYFCFSKTETGAKTLIGCQNWVTLTGWCQNLVPRWHLQCRVRGRRGLSHVHNWHVNTNCILMKYISRWDTYNILLLTFFSLLISFISILFE